MAVIDGIAREISEPNADTNGFPTAYRNGIFPSAIGFRPAVTGDHLKRVGMEMERVIHTIRVGVN
jgi:hypothetical protein